jgi:hypothetical protein
MKRNYLVLVFLLLRLTLFGEVDLTGFVRNYTGVLMKGDNKYSILQNTFDLNITQNNGKVAFKTNPYLYQDSDNNLTLGLREAYMDMYFDKMDLRIGKQQIIWGKADGVFITDIVSPKDLSEFLLPDFSEIRIGVTSLKTDYYLGDNTFEFVWIPGFTPTIMPEENSIWRPKMSFPVNPTWDFSKKEVDKNIKNSEFFAKISTMTSAVDLEFMAANMWDDDPAMSVEAIIDSTTHQIVSLKIFPEHHRLSVIGGSFSTTIGAYVFRGEGAYYLGKYFTTNILTSNNGLLEKNYAHYLFGIDTSFWDIKLSTQFVQQAILNYNNSIINDEFDNTVTFMTSKTFLRETLKLELFSYIGLNDEDALVRPKLIYDFSDGFQITIGSNLFFGDEGKFGQFNDNDMIFSKIKYSF